MLAGPIGSRPCAHLRSRGRYSVHSSLQASVSPSRARITSADEDWTSPPSWHYDAGGLCEGRILGHGVELEGDSIPQADELCTLFDMANKTATKRHQLRCRVLGVANPGS